MGEGAADARPSTPLSRFAAKPSCDGPCTDGGVRGGCFGVGGGRAANLQAGLDRLADVLDGFD